MKIAKIVLHCQNAKQRIVWENANINFVQPQKISTSTIHLLVRGYYFMAWAKKPWL
jgi:hypothetical protein